MLLDGEATLRWALEPLGAHLAHPATTELVVIDPGKFGVEQDGFWHYHEDDALDRDRLEMIAILSARLAGKKISPASPSIGAKLPNGERLKAAVPPAVRQGTVNLTIRKRAVDFTPTLEWLADRRYFELLDGHHIHWPSWFRKQLRDRSTFLVCGGIGESKTTFSEAILRAIPDGQRVITVESSSELLGLPHINWVQLFFDETDPDGAVQRIQDAMQMRPDWLCFQEVRGSEAWAYLRALKIGCPGITTVHSPTALQGLDSIQSMISQSENGGTIEQIIRQLRQYIGVVVHCKRFLPETPEQRTQYRLTEVVRLGQTPEEDTRWEADLDRLTRT